MTAFLFPKPVKQKRPRKPIRSRRRRKTWVNKGGHEFLHGIQAHAERRIQLFERAGGRVHVERDAEGKIEQITTEFPANCEMCAETHPLFFNAGEGGEKGDWCHVGEVHCDDLECALFGCRRAHIKQHHGRSF